MIPSQCFTLQANVERNILCIHTNIKFSGIKNKLFCKSQEFIRAKFIHI